VGIADPVYSPPGAPVPKTARGGLRLVRLEDSDREVRQVAGLFPPSSSRLLLRDDAREAELKRSTDLRRARYVHFATHGLLDERDPQYSGLVLTLERGTKETSPEDGLFQVYEIFGLELSADLVVLSACQSGLGKEIRGEGLVGLTQAFFYAGAPSVMVSLWSVADRSTADLMVSFYGQLAAGSGKAEALRQAKLELRRNERFGHPYYWAPFVLVGRP
jgi:CHAT domain-containing protein